MYKLIYFVPREHKESTKEALFKIGVGKYNNYECCSFETLGIGQFKPIGDADPFIGNINNLEKVEEYRIEMICKDALIQKAVQTLKSIHPYEEVAYDVIKLEDF
jgi:hypothetical protein